MNPPIPILFTIPNFVTAGTGRAMLHIVERLDRERFAPAICVLRRGGHLEREIEHLGIPYLENPFTVSPRPLATLLLRARRAAEPFRRHRFALWHSFHYLDDYTEPLIARLAGAGAWVYTKKNMSWNRRSWFLRTLLATRVVALNTDMRRTFFSSALFRRRSIVIPRGVDTARFRSETPPRLRLRQQEGVPLDAVVVCCVAHLVPVKSHQNLIRAMANVPGVFLWLAGKELDAGYAAELRRQVAELGLQDRVKFLGEVQDVPALLSEVDVVVLPTESGEGLGVALLEAMSSGRACVAMDVPGPRDIIEPGVSGLLVRTGDVAALAEALRELAGRPDRRHALSVAARERVVERFTIEGEVAAHEALYDGLLSRATSMTRRAA